MKPILILKTGSTFSALAQRFGDFEDWVIAASGEAPGLFIVADGVAETVPSLGQLAGIVVTGSHLMVSDGGPLVESWAQLLRDAAEVNVPVLGICYGHQLLAHAFGGQVANHPGGIELGQSAIEMEAAAQDDPLFSVLPRQMEVYTSHQQTVTRLPDGAFVYGRNPFEAHHAVRFAPAAWGVQFHPEFTRPIMQEYIRYQRPRLKSDEEMAALLSGVADLPETGRLLQRFCHLASR